MERSDEQLMDALIRKDDSAIATNIANDHFRKQKRSVFILALDDSLRPIPETAFKECATGTNCSPVTTLIKSELKEQVRRAIRVLPTRQRTALVLAYYHDLRYREVAEVMNCSVGTVKTHMSRALHKLAEILPDPDCLSAIVHSGIIRSAYRRRSLFDERRSLGTHCYHYLCHPWYPEFSSWYRVEYLYVMGIVTSRGCRIIFYI